MSRLLEESWRLRYHAELVFGHPFGTAGDLKILHVVGDGKARLARGKQRPEPLVRVLRRTEPGKHPHRPEAAPVARRVDAAGERRLAREADVAKGVGVVPAALVAPKAIAVMVDAGRPAAPGRAAVRPGLP